MSKLKLLLRWYDDQTVVKVSNCVTLDDLKALFVKHFNIMEAFSLHCYDKDFEEWVRLVTAEDIEDRQKIEGRRISTEVAPPSIPISSIPNNNLRPKKWSETLKFPSFDIPSEEISKGIPLTKQKTSYMMRGIFDTVKEFTLYPTPAEFCNITVCFLKTYPQLYIFEESGYKTSFQNWKICIANYFEKTRTSIQSTNQNTADMSPFEEYSSTELQDDWCNNASRVIDCSFVKKDVDFETSIGALRPPPGDVELTSHAEDFFPDTSIDIKVEALDFGDLLPHATENGVPQVFSMRGLENLQNEGEDALLKRLATPNDPVVSLKRWEEGDPMFTTGNENDESLQQYGGRSSAVDEDEDPTQAVSSLDLGKQTQLIAQRRAVSRRMRLYGEPSSIQVSTDLFHKSSLDSSQEKSAKSSVAAPFETIEGATIVKDEPVKRRIVYFEGEEQTEENGINEGKKAAKRLRRPCPFCFKHYTGLPEHYRHVHIDLPEIKHILTLPRKERSKSFSLLRNKGMAAVNKTRLGTGEDLLLARKLKGKDAPIAVCSNCHIYMSRKGLSTHKKICFGKKVPRGTASAFDIYFNDDVSTNKSFCHPLFEEDILTSIRKDKVGAVIKGDIFIIYIGNWWYRSEMNKAKASTTIRHRVSNIMRNLARIKIAFNSLPYFKGKPKLKFFQIFNVVYSHHLEKVIDELIYYESSSSNMTNTQRKLKPGMSNALQTMFKATFKSLCNYFAIKKDENVLNDIKTFEQHYLQNKISMLGEVESVIEKRLTKRCQLRLLDQHDIDFVKSECLNQINIIGKPTSEIEFCYLRRAVVTFLIVYNGSRPLEVSSITLDQWNLAKAKAYIPKEWSEKATIDEINLLKNYTIVFNTFQKNEVPVFVIDEEVIQAGNWLSDEEVRRKCEVLEQNKYLFPSTMCSVTFSNGTENVRVFIKDHCKIQKNLTAINVRRFLATKPCFLNLPASLRPVLTKLYGHSLNSAAYSCPPDKASVSDEQEFSEPLPLESLPSESLPLESSPLESSPLESSALESSALESSALELSPSELKKKSGCQQSSVQGTSFQRAVAAQHDVFGEFELLDLLSEATTEATFEEGSLNNVQT